MKKKMLSRLMAASLAAVMTVGLAGCGDNNTENPDATQTPGNSGNDNNNDSQGGGSEDPYVVLRDKDGNVPDLGGMEIIIADWFSGEDGGFDENWERTKEAPDAGTQALWDYQDWAMEKYNFKLKQMTVTDWYNDPMDFMNYVIGGGDKEHNYIWLVRPGGELTSYEASGYCYDLSTLDCLNFNEDKWGSQVHLAHTDVKTGAIYGMRPIYAEPRGGLYFNKRVLQEAGIDPNDIYKYQEDGTWTWDKFEEICNQITRDTDQDGENDVWAINGFNSTFYGSAVASNNAHFVGMEKGKYVNKSESNETVQALTWAMDIFAKHQYPQPADSSWDYFNEAWNNGIGAFKPGEVYEAGNMKPDVFADEFGFVCFPKGPNATDYNNWYNDNVYVIPACYDAQRAWNLAFALNVMTQPVEGYEDYKADMNNQYNNFRDMEAVDYTLKRMYTNGSVTYHTLVNGLDLGNDIYWKVNANNSLSQQLESIRNKWNYYIGLANGDLTEEDMPDELKPQEEDEG